MRLNDIALVVYWTDPAILFVLSCRHPNPSRTVKLWPKKNERVQDHRSDSPTKKEVRRNSQGLKRSAIKLNIYDVFSNKFKKLAVPRQPSCFPCWPTLTSILDPRWTLAKRSVLGSKIILRSQKDRLSISFFDKHTFSRILSGAITIGEKASNIQKEWQKSGLGI
jgi:hypothetical protein